VISISAAVAATRFVSESPLFKNPSGGLVEAVALQNNSK
jgi:hypothetical protein